MNLFTSEQIRLARQCVDADAEAKKIADRVISGAARWLDRDDATIRDLMPEASVPRSFSVNYVSGCPVHGSGPDGYKHYAQGGWEYDAFKDKWRVTCAIGGETYPSNDFEAFYRTGMQDRSLLTGPYADDGWGWRAEGAPYRHWFVGYCCQGLWQTVTSGLGALAHAYLLTGDARYAHKALIILDRMAEVYPDLDYATQSMYGVEMSPGYDGKMVSLISETGVVRRLCEAFDAVRDAIPSDPAFGPSADATLAKLERGIVGAGIDAVYREKARGNYGMHQQALLTAAIASGDRVEIDRAVDWVLNHTGEATALKEMWTSFDDYIFRDKAAHAEGLNFALDNLIFREGIGWESSPGYNNGWVAHLTGVAVLLNRAGVRVWDRPKFRRMYRWASEMRCLDRFVPSIGDMGNAVGSLVQLSPDVLRTAYAATGDPFIGELLRRHKAGYTGIDSLFDPIPEITPSKAGAAEYRQITGPSRLMGGYGLALLRTGKGNQRAAASLYYGRAATEHGHFDRLSLEIMAYGKKLVPDLGYAEHAAEGDGPALWTKNTISHTTVVVDGRRQDTQAPGRLVCFAAADGLSLAEVDAPDAYHVTSEYRRTVALIDLAPDARYVLDLFRVAGGDQHDYSIHGFDGAFTTNGIDLSPPQSEGTLAGEDIPFGDIYDDEGLRDPRTKGRSYYTYRGGGYSYLYDAQRGKPSDTWSATWRDEESNDGLRIVFLPSGEGIVAHGNPAPKPGNPRQLTYVLLRNAGDGIASRFAAVAEPFEGDPRIQTIEQVEQSDRAIELKIRHLHGQDTVRHAVDPTGTVFSLARRNPLGQITRLDLIGCGTVRAEGHVLTIAKGISGRVVAIGDETATVEIELDRGSASLRTRSLVGETARFGNGRRSTAYTITSVEGRGRRYRIGFGTDSFRVGRFEITGINTDGSGLSTRTYLYMAAQGYYRGAHLTDADRAAWLPVEDVKLSPHRPGARRDGGIRLVGKHDLHAHFRPGEIAYLYDLGPGDTFSVVPRATASRLADGAFRVKANCRAEFTNG